MVLRRDIVYPSLGDKDEQSGGSGSPKYESDESLPRTIFTSDITTTTKEGFGGPTIENPHADGYFNEKGRYIRSHGLNWVITGLFVVGDLAGGGLVALPTAMIQSGEYNTTSTLLIPAAFRFLVRNCRTSSHDVRCWIHFLCTWKVLDDPPEVNV